MAPAREPAVAAVEQTAVRGPVSEADATVPATLSVALLHWTATKATMDTEARV